MGKLIGLTGQTGAGKSTVSAILKDYGYYIIDGDVVARQIVEAGSPVLELLCREFGDDILNPDGSLNRRLLASRAFSDRQSTQRLNGITHPEIIRRSLLEAEKAFESGYEYAVFDAAGLFESGIDKSCECVISVTAEPDVRLARIMKRDGISEAEARKRMSAQYDDEYYASRSDYIIENSQLELLRDRVREVVDLIGNRQ